MPETLDDIQLRSEEVQEILHKVPNWIIRWGNFLIFALLLLVIFLSWLIRYPDIIPAEAIITTKIPPQKEYAKIGGKIASILVKDGQLVPEGAPLAILKNTANYQDVFALKSIIDTIPLNRKSFSFPVDDLPFLFLGDIEASFAVFVNNYSEYILNKQLRPYSNEALANEVTLLESYRRKENLRRQIDIAKTELNFSKNDFERQKSLFEKGVISKQQFESEKVKYLQAKRNYENNAMQLSQITESISAASKTSKTTKINEKKEEIVLFNKVLQSFNQLKKSLKDWEMKYVLQADITGRVSFLNIWTENQTVNAGDLVFIVIPSVYSSYIAKAKAPSQNSGKIKVGQRAIIKLENFPDNEFGVLEGTVKHISLLPNKKGMYLIDIELPDKLITSYNQEIPFKQEMKGAVEIITEDLRLIDRFFYQFKKIMNR